MNDYLALLIGVLCAGGGGELFVRGTVGMASALRIAPGIIAATVAAFATSSPELTVSLTAALAGTPQIALGDALGSNVVNVALILAVAVLIVPIRVPRSAVRRDFPTALVVPVIVGLLLLDGVLSRLDGILLLALFAGWLLMVVSEAKRQRSSAPEMLGEQKPLLAILTGIAGLALLVLAGSSDRVRGHRNCYGSRPSTLSYRRYDRCYWHVRTRAGDGRHSRPAWSRGGRPWHHPRQ